MVQGVKALAEEKLETKMKGWEELQRKLDKGAISTEKSKEKGKENNF